jgi:hypothetical protein
VLVFLGEGGERATVRRIEAIATAKSVDFDQLADRLRLCFRVPRLAAAGAGGANLYDMGAVLQAIQASANRRSVRCWW